MRARRVLVVDDEPEIVRSVVDALRAMRGLRLVVTGATDAREALRLARSAPFDLVVADLHMPHWDGLDILVAARERHPAGRRVLLTGDRGRVGHREEMLAACDAFVEKPLGLVALADLVLDCFAASAGPIERRRSDVRRRLEAARIERRRGEPPFLRA